MVSRREATTFLIFFGIMIPVLWFIWNYVLVFPKTYKTYAKGIIIDKVEPFTVPARGMPYKTDHYFVVAVDNKTYRIMVMPDVFKNYKVKDDFYITY